MAFPASWFLVSIFGQRYEGEMLKVLPPLLSITALNKFLKVIAIQSIKLWIYAKGSRGFVAGVTRKISRNSNLSSR